MPEGSVGSVGGLLGVGDRESIKPSVTMASNAGVFSRIQAFTLYYVLCGSKLPWPTSSNTLTLPLQQYIATSNGTSAV